MSIKRKPVIRDEATHECIQSSNLTRHQELIERTNLLLFGNGAPKNGLFFKFDKFMDEHETVVNNISEIKSSIDEIKGTVTDAIDSSNVAIRAIDAYKLKVASFNEGEKSVEEKQKKIKKEKWQRTIWIIMAVFAFIGLGTNLYFNIKGHNSTIQQVEAVQDTIRQEMRYQKGVSKISRGGYVLYNDQGLSDSIKVKK